MFENQNPPKQNEIPASSPYRGAFTPKLSLLGRLRYWLWPIGAPVWRKVLTVALASLVVVSIVGASAWFAMRGETPDAEGTKVGVSEPTDKPATQDTAPQEIPKTEEEPKKTDQKPATGGSTPVGSTGGSGGSSGSTGGSGGGSTPPASCALPNYPNASCTGVPAGTSLQAVSGTVFLTTDGEVYENKNVTGCVVVQAANVTIRNSKILCDFVAGISSSSTGLQITDVEVSCGSGATGISGHDYTATRVNVHDCENGFHIDHTVTIVDSYVHDLFHESGAHTDGIQISGNTTHDVTIRHNNLLNNDLLGTSSIIGDTGTFSNILIQDNLLGGGAYSLYCAIDPAPNYRVIGNHFSREFYSTGGSFGPWVYCNDETEVSGNVWHDDGQAVPF